MSDQASPLISIIIPSYNRSALISQTIESVIGQTYFHWEAIIVDDGSTDNSVALVENYIQNDRRIRIFIRDREPKGAPTCRNIGLQKSSGDFVIFLDSDDLIAPFCLEQRLKWFGENKTMDFLVFPILMFDQEIHDLHLLWNINTDEDDLLRFLRIDAMWQTTGPIYKRDAMIRLGGFREDLPFWQDFDLHLRSLLEGLAYKKFMDVVPDMYHRRNFKDSISRTISLTSDKAILQIRIDYYFSILRFTRERNIKLKKGYVFTIWSVLFYFISSYLIRHKNLHLFSRELLKAKRILGLGWTKFFLSYSYAILLAFSKRFSVLNILSDLYFKIFRMYLPNHKIIFSNNSLGKIKWQGQNR